MANLTVATGNKNEIPTNVWFTDKELFDVSSTLETLSGLVSPQLKETFDKVIRMNNSLFIGKKTEVVVRRME